VYQPITWRNWFIQQVPTELAVANIIVLVVLFFSLTIFASKVPLGLRILVVLVTMCLGTFLRVSAETAPVQALSILGVSWIAYTWINRKRRSGELMMRRATEEDNARVRKNLAILSWFLLASFVLTTVVWIVRHFA
jgi:hypothetical protein